jgi:manganese transport protein
VALYPLFGIPLRPGGMIIGAVAFAVLVVSQVVLSFGIPFALIPLILFTRLPLILFTRRRDLMGTLVNRRATTAAAVLVGAIVIALDLFLLGRILLG